MVCREYGLLCVGISCLQLFVQNNWVGPPSASPVDTVMSRAHNVEKVIPTLQKSLISEKAMNIF